MICNTPKLSIIIPCCNEAPMIEKTNQAVLSLLTKMISQNIISSDSYILYIDDGSRDATWSMIQTFSSYTLHVRGLKLSRNFGHQSALVAGLEEVAKDVDINICIDADLQHDIEKIPDFIFQYKLGNHLVFGVKNDRSTDSMFKRYSAQFFYKLLSFFGTNIIYNHADFRLMSRESLSSLLDYKEVNLFLRGIIPLLGFKSTKVYYDVKTRDHGESKYSLSKMISLAIEGITSFSIAPLRLITYLGLSICLGSFIAILKTIHSYYFEQVTPGWASTIVTICFFGGIQLVSIGIIGEYVGKIYKEVKKRPRYIIESKT